MEGRRYVRTERKTWKERKRERKYYLQNNYFIMEIKNNRSYFKIKCLSVLVFEWSDIFLKIDIAKKREANIRTVISKIELLY